MRKQTQNLVLTVVVCVAALGGLYFLGRGSKCQDNWCDTGPATGSAAPDTRPATKKPTLYFFTADWCSPCRQMKVVMEGVKAKEALKAYKLEKIDTDKDHATTQKYKITGIPAFVLVGVDGKEVKQTSGAMSEEDFVNWLK